MPDENGTSVEAAVRRAILGIARALPVIVTVVLLLGLFRTCVSSDRIEAVFSGSGFADVLIGTLIGSVSTGNAMTSYIIGGELLDHGVSLLAVTAFVVAWVTVGIVQLPAEMEILGRRFALLRNLSSAILAVVVATATVWTVGLLP